VPVKKHFAKGGEKGEEGKRDNLDVLDLDFLFDPRLSGHSGNLGGEGGGGKKKKKAILSIICFFTKFSPGLRPVNFSGWGEKKKKEKDKKACTSYYS